MSPKFSAGFNTQPPEGGWNQKPDYRYRQTVSTHSRLKAAGLALSAFAVLFLPVSTHSRLKAAGQNGGVVGSN